MAGETIRVLGWLARHSHDEHHDEDGDSVRGMVVAARNEHDAMKAEIARLKEEVASCRRHAVGVMAAGFNRALDKAGAPAAESPGLRIYAMRDEIARLKAELEAERFDTRILHRDLAAHKRALAAGPAALRAVALQARAAGETILADGALDCAANVEAAQEAAMKEKG